MGKLVTGFPLVAVVILNWNGRDFLRRFLPSVLASTYPQVRVIVADNGSTDDSLSMLEAEFPTVERLSLGVNYGFAQGYNEALRQVAADYYVLLNSDVEVTPGWLEPMVALLEKDSSIAICAPKLRAAEARNQFEYAGASGGWMDTLGYPFARGRVFDTLETDSGQYDTVEPVFWASGAALLVRASVYRELGGLDPDFFAHQEEIDFCWRAQRAGHRVFVCPLSLVYHVGGGALPVGSPRKTFLNFRNNHIMLRKNLSWISWLRVYVIRLGLDGVTVVRAWMTGDWGQGMAMLRGHVHFWGWCWRRSRTDVPVYPLGWPTGGLFRGSVVWQYFVKSRRLFSEIIAGK